MKKRVLVTCDLPVIAYQKLSKNFRVDRNHHPLTEGQLIRKVAPYHALLTTLADPITEKVLRAAPLLECVSNYAVGYNNIDIVAAKSRGIWVTNTPEVLTDATADIAWALILSCARRLPEGERMLRAGKFKGWHPLLLLGVDLVGKTLGIYGFGRIGKAVALRARGWDMKVLYCQRHREPREIEKKYNATYVPFRTLLRSSDILSVNAPFSQETKHRFGREEFKKMRRGCIFINTARGAIHDEKALVLALRKGWIHSAGLDVYEFEPKVEPGLLVRDNLTILPHLGSATVETRNRMALLAAENIRLSLGGRRPKTPVFEALNEKNLQEKV